MDNGKDQGDAGKSGSDADQGVDKSGEDQSGSDKSGGGDQDKAGSTG